MNAFFNSLINYCPLIWMCHSHENNNKINRHHERCLIIIYNDKRSSFNALLEKEAQFRFMKEILKLWQQECSKLAEI